MCVVGVGVLLHIFLPISPLLDMTAIIAGVIVPVIIIVSLIAIIIVAIVAVHCYSGRKSEFHDFELSCQFQMC